MVRNQTIKVILNGSPVSIENALIPAVGSALYYGTGCFETMKAESGKIFQFEEHIRRLNAGLNYLGADPKGVMDESQVKKEIDEVLFLNNLDHSNAKVRYQVSINENFGYENTEDYKLITLVTADEISPKTDERSLVYVKTRVIPTVCKPAEYKLSNMLHYRNAFRQARQAGADDGIMLTTGGFIAETSVSNIFWKIDDIIYTPSADCDILPGIMRNAVIDMFKDDGRFRVEQGKFLPHELFTVDSVWVTNSVIEISAVSLIDGRNVNNDQSFIEDIRNLMVENKRGYYENAR